MGPGGAQTEGRPRRRIDNLRLHHRVSIGSWKRIIGVRLAFVEKATKKHPIVAKLTRAPGNGAEIGGLKVVTAQGWFAARPSGTEDVYKIYAESFRDEAHLARILEEAREIVGAALKSA